MSQDVEEHETEELPANFQTMLPTKGGVYTSAHKKDFAQSAKQIQAQLTAEKGSATHAKRSQIKSPQVSPDTAPKTKQARSKENCTLQQLDPSVLPGGATLQVAPAEGRSVMQQPTHAATRVPLRHPASQHSVQFQAVQQENVVLNPELVAQQQVRPNTDLLSWMVPDTSQCAAS